MGAKPRENGREGEVLAVCNCPADSLGDTGGSYSAIGRRGRGRYVQVPRRQIDASLLPGERWGFKVQWSGGTSRCLCFAVVSKISAYQDTRRVEATFGTGPGRIGFLYRRLLKHV